MACQRWSKYPDYWNYLSVRSECISDSALLGVDNSPDSRENEKHTPERANTFRDGWEGLAFSWK